MSRSMHIFGVQNLTRKKNNNFNNTSLMFFFFFCFRISIVVSVILIKVAKHRYHTKSELSCNKKL